MKNIILVIILSFVFIGNSWAGGPWPKPKGKGYFKLSEWWVIFDKHYTDAGFTDPNVTTGIFNTSFYGEYGVTDRFTVIANANLFSRNYMNDLTSETTEEIIVPGEALNSIGDIDLGVKYGLTKPGAKIPIAISLTLGMPSGTTSGGELGNLQTGDGEFNQILQFDAGKSFKIAKTPSYISGYVGINNRSNGFSEEFRYGVELGLGLFKQKLWLTTKINAVESFKNGDRTETTTSPSIFANNTEFFSIGVEASLYLTKKIGVSAGMATATRGENIAAAPSYTIGVFYDLK